MESIMPFVTQYSALILVIAACLVVFLLYRFGGLTALSDFFRFLNALNQYKYGNLSKVRRVRKFNNPVLLPNDAEAYSHALAGTSYYREPASTPQYFNFAPVLGSYPKESDSLYAFMNKKSLFSWWFLCGKNYEEAMSLAFAVCAESSSRTSWFKQVWRAGVVDSTSTDFSVWKHWQPSQHTLLVIALSDLSVGGNSSEEGTTTSLHSAGAILDNLLANLQYNGFKYPVRVLFVAPDGATMPITTELTEHNAIAAHFAPNPSMQAMRSQYAYANTPLSLPVQ